MNAVLSVKSIQFSNHTGAIASKEHKVSDIFFIVKFSVEYQLDEHRAMQLAKASKKKGQVAYRQALFAPKRMQQRFSVFENITLQSLAPNLRNPNARLICLASDSMPEKYKGRLNALIERYPNAEVRYCGPIKSVDIEAGGIIRGYCLKKANGSQNDIVFATVRLDDDDALSSNFVELLSPYVKSEFSGFWISFPAGVRMSIDAGRVVLTKAYLPKTSQGLARISAFSPEHDGEIGTAYGLGSHARVDLRAPVIMDGRQIAYVRTNHKNNDSRGRRLEWFRHWIQVSAEPDFSAAEVTNIFSFEPASVGFLSKKSFLQKSFSRLSALLYQRA